MNHITLGPFITPHVSQPTLGQVGRKVDPLPVTVEWANATRAFSIPLFYHREPWDKDMLKMGRIVCHVNEIPCDMRCPAYQVVEEASNTYVPFEAVLATMYHREMVSRSIYEVLDELATLLPFQQVLPQNTAGLLHPIAEHHGYRLTNTIIDETDNVFLDIGWVPPSRPTVFHACLIALDDKTWQEPTTIGIHIPLAKTLKQITPIPGNILTEPGTQHVHKLQRKEKNAPN